MPDTDTMPAPFRRGAILDTLAEFARGNLSPVATLDLFSDIVRSGLVRDLPGSFLSTAETLLRRGWLLTDGTANPVLRGTLCDVVRCPQRVRHIHAPAGPTPRLRAVE